MVNYQTDIWPISCQKTANMSANMAAKGLQQDYQPQILHSVHSGLKVSSTQLPRVSAAPSPLQRTAGRALTDWTPHMAGQSQPAINKPPAPLTSACTEHVLLDGRSSAGGLHPDSPLSLSLSPLSPPESAVHLAPQIAYDSRAISSRGLS